MRPAQFTKGWKATRYGGINLLDPQPEQVSLLDIAHALAHTCRYGGSCVGFFSVAEHSVNVCDLVRKGGASSEVIQQALLHDAAEAYMGDMPTPLKRLLPDFENMERQLFAVIAERFGIPAELDPKVKRADLVALVTEAAIIMDGGTEGWGLPPEIAMDTSATPRRCAPMEAKAAFLITASMLGVR